jgi:hypothetical protein
LALKLLELDGGDVLERFAKCGAWSVNVSGQTVTLRRRIDVPLMFAEKYV